MFKFKLSLNLRMKLIILIVIPLALYVGSTFYWMHVYDSGMNTLSNSLFSTTNQVNTLVLNADRDLYQSLTAFQSLQSQSLDAASAAQLKDDMAANAKQATDRIEQAVGILDTNEMLQLKKKDNDLTIQKIVTDFRSDFTVWLNFANKSVADGVHNPYNADLIAQFEKAREGINQIGEIMEQYASDEILRTHEDAKKLEQSSIIGVLFCTLVMLIIGFFIILNLSKAVQYILALTHSVSQGDLRARPHKKHSKDELGIIAGSIETMIANVRKLIVSISDNALQVTRASEQMTASSRQSATSAAHVSEEITEVSEGMEVQARGAEETARAIEEMAIGIGRVAENTSNISDSSIKTSYDAEQGQAQLDQLASQMEGIRKVIGQLSDIVTHLSERSNEIGTIAVNITDFSNQTNILSLNASIEAARAGEHGRGFAVVASEIRKLASQSLESADVINQLVTSTQNDMTHASSVMASTLSEVAQGGQLMKDVNASFLLIRDSIHHIAAQIHDNSAITEQMSASSEEVSATMEQSAQTAKRSTVSTQSVAAATKEQLMLMDEIIQAAEHLQAIVQELDRSVATFKI